MVAKWERLGERRPGNLELAGVSLISYIGLINNKFYCLVQGTVFNILINHNGKEYFRVE